MESTRDGSRGLKDEDASSAGWRRLRVVASAAAVVGACAVLAACGDSSDSGSTASDSGAAATSTASAPKAAIAYDGPEKNVPDAYPESATRASGPCTIGYQTIFAAIPVLAEMERGAKAEATKLGCKFIALDDQLNPTTQVNNFNQLLSQHVGAIVVFPIVPEALGPQVAKAAAAGIPVVANSTPAAADQPVPKGYSTRVLQSFDTIAYNRAKYIAEQHPGAKTVIMGLAQPVASLQYFAKRAAYWADRFGLDVLGEVDQQQDNPGSASAAMAQVLSRYPDVQAVFTYNDNTAVAAALAAKAAGKQVAVCGQGGGANAFKAIKDGTLACTSLLHAREMGAEMARGAYALIADKNAKVPQSIKAKVTLVTPDNVKSLTPVG